MTWSWLFSFWRKPARTHPESHRAGAWGEALAADHLKQKGYRILGRNVRFGSRSELDIVARSPSPEALVFVEVKTRRSETHGRPIDFVDRGKRRALGRAAHHYLRRLSAHPARIRFDVIEIVGRPGDNPPEIRHIENAFTPWPNYRIR